MFRRTLKVTYSPLKNNFVLLPDQYYRLVSAYRNGCMNISPPNGLVNYHITWTPYPVSTRENDIGINPQIAEAIGVREGDIVNVSMVIEARSLKRVEVSPMTETDWTMMEINANRIQSILLDQTRVVNKGQILVIWISDSICVKTRVDFMMPLMPFGRLENDTEVVVIPWSKKPSPTPPVQIKQPKQEILKEPSMFPLAKSSTNSEIAKLVQQRKLQRKNTTELTKIPNGTPENEPPKTKRPVSWYKNAIDDIHKKEKEEELPIIPRTNILKKNRSVRHSMFDRLADEPVKKKVEDLPLPLPSPPPFLKRNNSSLFEQAVDNHLNNLKTSKSVANMICNGEKENVTPKYRNKNEYIDDMIACLAKESTKNFEFRVVPGVWNEKSYHQISDLFLTKDNLPNGLDPNLPFLLLSDGNKEFYVNVKIVKDPAKFPRNIYPSIEVNDTLRKILDLNEFEKIILKPQQRAVNLVEKIDLIPATKVLPNIRKDIEEKFKEFIINNSKLYPVILNQDQVFKILDYYFTVKLEPDSLRFCLVNAKILKENKILCIDSCKPVDSLVKLEEIAQNLVPKKEISIEKFEKIVEECVDRLKLKLCLDERSQCRKIENILIAGPTFSGRRSICNKIIKALQEAPYFCYATTFQCSKHKGRKPDSIQKDLRHQFYLSMYHTPSVVFLDNLDVLVHQPTEQNTQDGEYYNKIADIFRCTIEEFTKNNPISVIASVTNVSSLNRRVHLSRGHHIFNYMIKMPNLDKTDRELVVKNLCANTKCKLDKKTNYRKFSILTEGYTIGNLVQFIDRAVFYAFKKSFKAPTLTDEMLNQALEVTNSFCLQGIENHQKNEYDEDDDDEIAGDKVPGLENAIDVFQEVLMWPSKFPKVFENSPLRNQAGILLFGPPGTGKTYLVAKLSKTCNLRMISVKGPELLAKYIGQSEENVRNLFDKARSAKPCVLFFDEFDSLAPRRGHDSTGVTDRVVNQLLTELDGVEGLHGVTVIGATSRPELLDPALLRSGRMDRLVECYLPNKKSRLEIFKNLSKSLHFDDSVKLKHFADKSESYTGADIQSILTSANMIAVKECLENNTENVPDKIYITQKHLMEAFNSTRPSLSPTDIAKYKLKYAKFTNKETVNDFLAQRATLA